MKLFLYVVIACHFTFVCATAQSNNPGKTAQDNAEQIYDIVSKEKSKIDKLNQKINTKNNINDFQKKFLKNLNASVLKRAKEEDLSTISKKLQPLSPYKQDAVISALKHNFSSLEKFNQQIRTKNLTPKELREEYKNFTDNLLDAEGIVVIEDDTPLLPKPKPKPTPQKPDIQGQRYLVPDSTPLFNR